VLIKAKGIAISRVRKIFLFNIHSSRFQVISAI
jgi:hypothetical protein